MYITDEANNNLAISGTLLIASSLSTYFTPSTSDYATKINKMKVREIREHSIICLLSILIAAYLIYAACHLDMQLYQNWLDYFKL